MLVLRRKEGQWTEITHKSGDVLRIRTKKIGASADRPGETPGVDLCFDDGVRNFEIERPERTDPLVRGRRPVGGHRPVGVHSVAHPFPSVEASVEAVRALESKLNPDKAAVRVKARLQDRPAGAGSIGGWEGSLVIDDPLARAASASKLDPEPIEPIEPRQAAAILELIPAIRELATDLHAGFGGSVAIIEGSIHSALLGHWYGIRGFGLSFTEDDVLERVEALGPAPDGKHDQVARIRATWSLIQDGTRFWQRRLTPAEISSEGQGLVDGLARATGIPAVYITAAGERVTSDPTIASGPEKTIQVAGVEFAGVEEIEVLDCPPEPETSPVPILGDVLTHLKGPFFRGRVRFA